MNFQKKTWEVGLWICIKCDFKWPLCRCKDCVCLCAEYFPISLWCRANRKDAKSLGSQWKNPSLNTHSAILGKWPVTQLMDGPLTFFFFSPNSTFVSNIKIHIMSQWRFFWGFFQFWGNFCQFWLIWFRFELLFNLLGPFIRA